MRTRNKACCTEGTSTEATPRRFRAAPNHPMRDRALKMCLLRRSTIVVPTRTLHMPLAHGDPHCNLMVKCTFAVASLRLTLIGIARRPLAASELHRPVSNVPALHLPHSTNEILRLSKRYKSIAACLLCLLVAHNASFQERRVLEHHR